MFHFLFILEIVVLLLLSKNISLDLSNLPVPLILLVSNQLHLCSSVRIAFKLLNKLLPDGFLVVLPLLLYLVPVSEREVVQLLVFGMLKLFLVELLLFVDDLLVD